MPSRMLVEIHQIPAVIRDLLVDGADGTTDVAAAIRAAQPRVVVIAARGTSDHAAVYARYLIESHLHLPVVLAANSLTTIYAQAMHWQGALVLGISQSGEATDVAAVLSEARRDGALTIAITNTPGSLMARIAEHTLYCRAGVERSMAATKTYVAELVVVAMLVGALLRAHGPATYSDVLGEGLIQLPDMLQRVIDDSQRWVRRAEDLRGAMVASDRALVVSRGYNFATALEIALKLKETSRMFADGYSSADLLHGPLVLAGPEIPVLVIRPNGRMGVALDGSIARIRQTGARPWVIGASDLAGREDDERVLALPVGLPEPLTPVGFVIPGQLVAEAVARQRGLDPDAPPGLAKITRTM